MNGLVWHLPWHLLFNAKRIHYISEKCANGKAGKNLVQVDECQKEDSSVQSDSDNNCVEHDDFSECDSDNEVTKDNNMDSDVDSNVVEDFNDNVAEEHDEVAVDANDVLDVLEMMLLLTLGTNVVNHFDVALI